MIDEDDSQFDPEVELPPGLRRALREADRVALKVPPAVDAAVQAAARQHFRSLRRRRLLRIWVPVSAAAAAILLLFVFAEPVLNRARRSGKPPIPTRLEHVTILDAFALARQLEAREGPGREWDYNADGTVDQHDVDALAMAAVRLEKGT
jgi:hypothetical protein